MREADLNAVASGRLPAVTHGGRAAGDRQTVWRLLALLPSPRAAPLPPLRGADRSSPDPFLCTPPPGCSRTQAWPSNGSE